MDIDDEKKEFLLELANRQRTLIYIFSAYLVSLLVLFNLPEEYNIIPNLVTLILFISCLVCMFKLVNHKYGMGKAIGAIILCCIPVVNLATLAVVVTLNNSYFKTLGFNPGIIGVNPDVIGEI